MECKLRQGGSESQKKSGFPEKEQKTSFLCGFLVTCQCKGRFYSKKMYPKVLHDNKNKIECSYYIFLGTLESLQSMYLDLEPDWSASVPL